MTVENTREINDLERFHGVPTREDLRSVAEEFRSYLDTHCRYEGTQAFQVLRKLIELTISQLNENKTEFRFSTGSLARNVFGVDVDADGGNRKLKQAWKNLVSNLEGREAGLRQTAEANGMKFFPGVEKTESKGSYENSYYLVGKPISNNAQIETLVPSAEEINYILEISAKPSFLAAIFLKNGYRIIGWRKFFFFALGLLAILLPLTLVYWLLYSFFWSPISIVKNVPFITISFFLSAAFIVHLRQTEKLLDWRIIMAPIGYMAFNENNLQIEIVREPTALDQTMSVIRLVRYAGTCPKCTSKVELHDGKREFPNRLIGRCKEHPSEHIYSFDRFSRRGKSLR